MAATNDIIIFSVAQNRRRWWHKLDNDAQANDPAFSPRTGEGKVLVATSTSRAPGFDPDAFLAQQLGASASPDRCCGFDSNNICQAVFPGDPAIDSVPGLTIVQHNFGYIGDTWNGSTFTRQFAVCNPSTGHVDQVAQLDVSNPVSPVAGDTVVQSATAQVGQTIPLKSASAKTP